MKNEYTVIGLMSGTSLDGLDMASCRYIYDNGKWLLTITNATTIEYDEELKTKLTQAHLFSALELMQLNVTLGKLHGDLVKAFMDKHFIKPDFIASHGHTVFHQPYNSFTTQIGSPSHIATICGVPVIADFRSNDVALGGQGAPLVPIGDLLLFKDYELCLNLGGVANISIKVNKGIRAFDICICNMALNHLAERTGETYDSEGRIAASGNIVESILKELNALEFFQSAHPKSLGKEFYDEFILPIVNRSTYSVEDLMRTFVEHIAMQISRHTKGEVKMLITGGGAFNSFLIERLRAMSKANIILPDEEIIQFKEAVIFGFLGVLRIRGEVNCLSSVTGASRDNVGGAIYLP